ncbi:MAG TPA: hypothetical protein DCW47_08850 [Lachnospiraceae bacterium]|nr:hypothetical protein [Lachnospiraceae bacterium]
MKRLTAAVLIFTMTAMTLTACAGVPAASTAPAATEVGAEADAQAGTDEADAAVSSDEKGEGVMTYAEYEAAELNSEVTVETYIQGANAWWDGKITLYTQDKDGAYFIYELPCTEEEAAKLVPGTKIKVTGYKSEWSGEIEIVDGVFEIEEGNYIAEAKDVTELLGKDELIENINQFVSFKGLTIEPSTDASGNEAPFLYNWDGSGDVGNDVYFNVSKDGQTFTFLVRSYLTGPDTEVYKTAQTLKVGDTIDCDGFLYWYEGANPHITSITIK